MEHIIIGTAGHIDHGKTALIRALTGRETDTLKEEKKRGISIDLGFTYFDLPDGSRAGVIDVPGHEKFLSNMLAGVCGMGRSDGRRDWFGAIGHDVRQLETDQSVRHGWDRN